MTATTDTKPAYYKPEVGEPIQIPQKLIGLRLEWIAVDRLHSQLCQALPSGRDVLAGVETPTDLINQLADVRGELQRITREIHGHGWWATVDNRHLADTAMRAAAKESELLEAPAETENPQASLPA